MNLTLRRDSHTIPIAVEVFGTIHTATVDAGGNVAMTLYLTRRYINKEPAFGVWPKTGKTEYPTTVKAGEVVSFLLPPLADDGGILLGHRFSLRLRIKPVAAMKPRPGRTSQPTSASAPPPDAGTHALRSRRR